MSADQRHIIIVALRRSGTTALWRLFRQDAGVTCYDEPFNPKLAELPAEHPKGTRAELIALYRRDPQRFRAAFAPMPRADEVATEFSPAQDDYLRFLTAGGPTVIDTTRCLAKIPALAKVMRGAVLVHLYRHPAAFASSHLLPSQGGNRLRAAWRRKRFFDRTRGFASWGMEDLLRPPIAARTHALMVEEGIAPPPASARAVDKLLALWLLAFRRAEREGRAQYGARFLSLSFEDFCTDPQAHLACIRTMAGAGPFDFDVSALHAANPGHSPGDPRWAAAAARAGFAPEELARWFGG